MSESERGMSPQPTTTGVGARRRRREAERAAAAAAMRDDAPVSRKELRRRAAEEEARLEGLRTGELRLDGSVAPSVGLPPTTQPPRPTEQAERDYAGNTSDDAARDATPDDAASDATPDDAASDATPDGGSRDASSASDLTSNGSVPAGMPLPDARVAAGVRVPHAPGAEPRMSRRSLRDRQAVDPTGTETPASQRTATGRRPVVRAPSTAQGTRALDSTGRLTGVIPVVPLQDPAPTQDPASPAPVSLQESSVVPLPRDEGSADPVSWESTAGMPVMSADLLDREAERFLRPSSPVEKDTASAFDEEDAAADVVVPGTEPAETRESAADDRAPRTDDAAARPDASTDRAPDHRDAFPTDAPESLGVTTDQAAGQERDAATDDAPADVPGEDGPLRPQWVALRASDVPVVAPSAAPSGATVAEAPSAGRAQGRAQGEVPNRRSLGDRTRSGASLDTDAVAHGARDRDLPDPAPLEEDAARANPAVTFVKVLVLLLVVAVIAALIWLLSSGALDGIGAALPSVADTVGSVQALSDLPEESRAR